MYIVVFLMKIYETRSGGGKSAKAGLADEPWGYPDSSARDCRNKKKVLLEVEVF